MARPRGQVTMATTACGNCHSRPPLLVGEQAQRPRAKAEQCEQAKQTKGLAERADDTHSA
jgi:hypothetical protein